MSDERNAQLWIPMIMGQVRAIAEDIGKSEEIRKKARRIVDRWDSPKGLEPTPRLAREIEALIKAADNDRGLF